MFHNGGPGGPKGLAVEQGTGNSEQQPFVDQNPLHELGLRISAFSDSFKCR